MPRIRFLEDRTGDSPRCSEFTKGSEHELSDASVNHWIIRGAAVVVTENNKPKVSEETEKPDPKAKKAKTRKEDKSK